MSSYEDDAKLPIVRGDVAIIGMSCIFPDAPDLNTFWQNIISKVDAITDVPPDRWDPEIYFDPDSVENDRVYCKRGGYLRNPTRFNPLDYGIMPIAVEGGDPSQFLALEVAYQALGNAGYLNRLTERERVEIILGRGSYVDAGIGNAIQHIRSIEQTLQILKRLHPEYTQEELQAIKKELKASLRSFGPDNAPSLLPNITTGRISNRLDLMGSNFIIDAACASSLIAAELGIYDLLTRKCDLTLVGGIFILPDVLFPIVFCQLKALSHGSQIRPFDKNADGTIVGEGVGVVVLKRLEDAERDGDIIYAVIKGVGSSSDGRASSVIATRAEGAELALQRAYEIAGISPRTISLIEGHGSGTPAGDAAEIEVLNRVFGGRNESYPWCALGTVKSMIGHTMHAAGVAGLIKTALALYHKVLPPTLYCDEPHPGLKQTPFYINSETRPWIHGLQETPRRAGINAFGFGGVNAHMVLEEYPNAGQAKAVNHLLHWETEVCILQAQSRHSLMQRAQQLEQYLQANPRVLLKDLAYTLNKALGDAPYSLAMVVSSPEDFQQKLQYAIRSISDPQCTQIKDVKGIYFFEKTLSRDGKLAFMFPGEGSQYIGMLSDLCIHFPEVRAHFDELDAAFINAQWSFLPSQIIFPPPKLTSEEKSQVEKTIWQMDSAIQAVLTANKALLALLTHLQIKPDVILGYSSGEFSAMFASEMAETNLQHVHELASIYKKLITEGDIPEANTVAVGANYALVSSIVNKIDGNIYIAMDNCPHQVVVVGDRHAIEKAIDEFQSKGIIYSNVPSNWGYHTPLYKSVCEHFRQFFREQPVYAPKVETWSSTTMQPYPQDVAEIQKLADNDWVNTVRFRETIEAMYTAGVRIFVEVGPRGNLTAFVDDILHNQPYVAVASDVPHRSGITQLNHLVGVLVAQGVPMRLDYLYSHRAPQQLSLDEEHITDEKHATDSMMLPLELPFMNVAHRKSPTKKTRAAPTDSQAIIKPYRNMASGLSSPIAQQESKGASTSQTHHYWFEKAAPESDAVAGEDKVADVSPQALEDYFQTMRHFLEAQQSVMQAYLTGKRTVREQDSRVRDQSIAAQTHRSVDTEGPPIQPPPQVEKSQPAEIGDKTPQEITQVVLDVVSERTGYPKDMLDLNLDMEADLGIDSIKRIEILGVFQEQFTSLQEEAGEIDIEQIANLKTLQQVIDFVREKVGASETRENMPTLSTTGNADRSAIPSKTAEENPQSEFSGMGAEAQPFPFIETIISYVPGDELVARCQINLGEYIFLHDHTISSGISVTGEALKPLCIIPMTVSMEMMAEAATRLVPRKLLIGMKDIRTHQWIMVEEEKPKNIHISAKRLISDEHDEVMVSIWNMVNGMEPESTKGSPAVEGTMVFGDTYPQPPSGETLSLKSERCPKYSAAELYSENLMFQGPRFQGVVVLDRSGENGIEGQIEALSNTDLFRSNPSPLLITDPFLMDAIAQLVGYWPLEHLGVDFKYLPTRISQLHLYGPKPRPTERFKCRVRISQVTSKLVRADIDVIDSDDCVRMRLIGWEDWRVYWSSELIGFLKNPKSMTISVPWDTPISEFREHGSFQCYRLNIAVPDQAAFKDLWAHAVLTQREKKTWQHLKGREARQGKWLIRKLVAKDAVRIFLKKNCGIELSATEIEIATDEHGRPFPRGAWTNDLAVVPSLSLASTDGLAVAVVGYCHDDQRIGIDVELICPHTPGFIKIAFDMEERQLLLSLDESTQQEWITRFWCAKEAVAKALGRGLIEGPQSLVVQQLDTQTGVICVSLRGKLAEMFPEFIGAKIKAYTAREEDYIAASSICEKG